MHCVYHWPLLHWVTDVFMSGWNLLRGDRSDDLDHMRDLPSGSLFTSRVDLVHELRGRLLRSLVWLGFVLVMRCIRRVLERGRLDFLDGMLELPRRHLIGPIRPILLLSSLRGRFLC